MKKISRRDFLKFGSAGVAGLAATAKFPMLGRMALAAVNQNVFNIAVISDTQNYSDGRYQPASSSNAWQNGIYNLPYFIEQMNYLKTNSSALNLAFVSHVGDVVQNGDGSTLFMPGNKYTGATSQNIEWLNAQQAIDILDAIGVPYGLVPGNHDYDNMDYSAAANKYPPLVSTAAYWKNTFGSGSKYFSGKSWYVGASDNVGYISSGAGGNGTGMWPAAGTLCNYGLSSAQVFTAGGVQYLHIALEMEAGGPACLWAQGVINAHPGYPTILTTHSYLSPFSAGSTSLPATANPPVSGSTKNSYNGASYCTNSPSGWNGAKGIWDNLIAPNNQIFMVLCGHSWGGTTNITGNGKTINGVSTAEGIRIDRNMSGNPVYQILSDYQGNTTLGSMGGDGWYRFMQFDTNAGNIHFYTYNTFNGALAGQSSNGVNTFSDFDQPTGYSDFSLTLPAQVTNPSLANINIVSSGFTYNRASKLYSATLTLTNTGSASVKSQVGVSLENLVSGATLYNKVGTDAYGCPYTTVSNNGLAPGASLAIPVQFSASTSTTITYTPVMIQL